MEKFNGSIVDKLKRSSAVRKGTLAASAVVLVAACSTHSANYPGENVLRHELETGQAADGRTIATFVVKGADNTSQSDLDYNGGVNVRVSNIGDVTEGLKQTTIVTVAPVGRQILADEFYGKPFVDDNGAVAFECSKVSDLIASSIRQNYQDKVCYIFRADKYLQKAE